MFELKKLSIDDVRNIYEMLQEIPSEENGLINKANGLTYDIICIEEVIICHLIKLNIYQTLIRIIKKCINLDLKNQT